MPIASPSEAVAAAPGVVPELMQGWLRGLDTADPVRAGRAIVEQFTSLNGQRVRITLRQEINEAYFPVIQLLLARLERDLHGAELPLAPLARAAARTAEDLIVQLGASYKALMVEQSRRLFGFASSGRALLPVQRSMQLLGQRLVLSYRIYSTPPKGVWSELHELYQFAARRGLSQRQVDADSATPLSIYKAALLVAFADPLRLMDGDLELVLRIVDKIGDRAHVGLVQEHRAPQGVFVIRPHRDVAGYSLSKRHVPDPQNHDLILNTLPVAEALVRKLAKLGEVAPGEEVELPVGADIGRAKELYARLIKLWGMVPNRRHNRLRTHARVEINVGIGDIWAFLNGGGAEREEPAAASDAPSLGGEWVVTNESRTGFALKHVSGPLGAVRVGEVIGLRVRNTPSYHICVVRWVLSDNPEHLELGLEDLAPTARPARVRKLRDGQAVGVPALLLPEVPEQGKAPTILAPLSSLDSTCELSIGELQAKLRIRPTQLVERTSTVQVLQFNSIG